MCAQFARASSAECVLWTWGQAMEDKMAGGTMSKENVHSSPWPRECAGSCRAFAGPLLRDGAGLRNPGLVVAEPWCGRETDALDPWRRRRGVAEPCRRPMTCCLRKTDSSRQTSPRWVVPTHPRASLRSSPTSPKSWPQVSSAPHPLLVLLVLLCVCLSVCLSVCLLSSPTLLKSWLQAPTFPHPPFCVCLCVCVCVGVRRCGSVCVNVGVFVAVALALALSSSRAPPPPSLSPNRKLAELCNDFAPGLFLSFSFFFFAIVAVDPRPEVLYAATRREGGSTFWGGQSGPQVLLLASGTMRCLEYCTSRSTAWQVLP
eukprot:3932057-Rhodomonas_salina.1